MVESGAKSNLVIVHYIVLLSTHNPFLPIGYLKTHKISETELLDIFLLVLVCFTMNIMLGTIVPNIICIVKHTKTNKNMFNNLVSEILCVVK